MFIDIIDLFGDMLAERVKQNTKQFHQLANSIICVTVQQKDDVWYVAVNTNGFQCRSEEDACRGASLLLAKLTEYRQAQAVATPALYSKMVGKEMKDILGG